MPTAPLTQAAIELQKPKSKPYKVADGGGLFLLVNPNGSKLWRLTYRVFEPKPKTGEPRVVQKVIALGAYDPKTNGLVEARARREAAKLALKGGRDPARIEHTPGGSDKFETVARAWYRHKAASWERKYAGIVLKRLESYVFPEIGHLPIGSVKKSDVLAVLRKIEDRGIIETAHRVREYIGGTFRFCDDDDVADPTPALKGRLKPAPRVQHHKSLKRAEIGDFLAKLDASECEPTTRQAILLTILTAARTNEIIGARWDEFENLRRPGQALWRIPAERMKESREHLVPLSTQAVALLKEMEKARDLGGYVFPARGGYGTMSNNTMLFHCYAMGYRNKTTMHGWRGSFSTIANESGLWAPDVIELCLAHVTGSEVRRAYNSAQHLPKRRELLQWWADEMDKLRGSANWHVGLFGRSDA